MKLEREDHALPDPVVLPLPAKDLLAVLDGWEAMLAACKAAEELLSKTGARCTATYDQLVAAIAKAEGRRR